MSDEEQKAIFARNFNRAMKSRKVRQIDIVNDLNINSSTVSNWSNGVMLPRSQKLKLLAEYLRVPEAFLMGWTVSDEEIGNVFHEDMSQPTENISTNDSNEDTYTESALFNGESQAEKGLEILRQLRESILQNLDLSFLQAKELLGNITSLNEEGQQKVKEYVDDLSANPKYLKDKDSDKNTDNSDK